MLCIFPSIKQRVCFRLHALQERVWRWIKPLTTSLVPGTFADLTRSKAELLAENALLRHQLIILLRQFKRPVYQKTDRVLLVFLQALFIVQPETLLRWHRELFRVFWKHKSKAHSKQPRLSHETIGLIREMAANNRLWGAERIRGELLKLDIRVSKRSIQKYMKQIRPKRAPGQSWKTFLRNHAAKTWACDFLPVTDLFFRSLYAFFIIELKSRKIIHVNVTRSPTDPWVAQQLREATPYGQTPTYLIRDNDRKFGQHFARVAATSGIKVLRTPYRTPRANCHLRTLFGKRQARMPEPFPDLAGETAPPSPQGLCQVLQSSSATSRDPAADSGPTGTFGPSTTSAEPGDLSSRVGWITSYLPKSSINLGKRVYRGQVKLIRRNRMVASM